VQTDTIGQRRIKTKGSTSHGERRKVRNRLNDLTAKEWIQETVSVFTQKGLGQDHRHAKIEREHPAPFSFQDVGRLIRFFTKEHDKVLDPFCGVGSTLKACALANRNGFGIELVRKYCELTKCRLREEISEDLYRNAKQVIINGDAFEEVEKFEEGFFDFILTSPPYWRILHKVDHKVRGERVNNNLDIKYSDDKRDLGNIESYAKFVSTLTEFFGKCSRILKPKRYMCVIVSDFRHKSRYYTLHSDLANELQRTYYSLKGITILYQKFKKLFPYGYPYAYVPNIHHQYILILENHAGKK
jgi:DNA modification methylase